MILDALFFDTVREILKRFRSLLPRSLGGADVLRGPGGGHTKVRSPTGFAPWRAPARAPRPPALHPGVPKVFRNAVMFLFDHCDLGVVPAQFWPFLDQAADPGEAVSLFLQAIGCDPELIRRGDRAEREKAAEIIDFLVMSGDIFDHLSPEAREELGSRLEGGDYTKVRDAARLAADLRAALDVETHWRGASLLPSFENLLKTVRKLAAHPLKVAPDDVEEAARLARAYSAAQADFDGLCGRYDRLVADLHGVWASTGWSGGDEETTLRTACGAFDASRNGLRTVAELNIRQVQYAIEGMRSNFEKLQRLLDRARSHAAGRDRGHGGARAGGSGGGSPPPRSKLDGALDYFGWSRSRPPSLDELTKEWKARHLALHRSDPPDRPAQARDLNRFRDEIRDFLKAAAPAAA
jgi:hypothetical protein